MNLSITNTISLKRTLIISILLMLCSVVAIGQNSDNKGSLEIIQDEKISEIGRLYKEIQLQRQTTSGYRIQIYSESGANSKSSALNVIQSFQKIYSEKAYLEYHQPYYKVLIGDYTSRIEASRVIEMIESNYPNAFIIKDEINLY